MKYFLLALYGCFFGIAVIASPLLAGEKNQRLLGTKQCTWGPSFWCSNITNAKTCHAVTHCIQTVWEKHAVSDDNDSICKICLDMVKQARDQLESNDTQADLKAVFEGSCKLIPLKPVQKECIRLADDFVPELVEALTSQMNPQAVCSVAGLCNNAAIDKMLEELEKSASVKRDSVLISNANKSKLFTCNQCNHIGGIISEKFHGRNRDEVLETMLFMCGKMSSLSDACANIVLIYFNELYTHLNVNLNSESLCHMAGVCTDKYHQHSDVIEIRPMSNVGFVDIEDDIPCELCEQLVRHLRDVLIANTTVDEFKTVLKGLCGQTKSFKAECISIVEQYYDVIYDTLVKNLNENEACALIEICPRGLKNDVYKSQIMPIIPVQTVQQLPKKMLGVNEPKLTISQIQQAQLPIDTLLLSPNSQLLIDGGKWCMICEYVLHFLQVDISSPKTEENIKRAVDETCDKLPQFVGECHSFVETYGDAVIALLVQEIDPREVCPKLFLCPQNKKQQWDIDVFSPKTVNIAKDVEIDTKNSGSDKCPLCLLAVQAAKDIIQSDKSKKKIVDTLDGLCRHLPNKLLDECTDFIDTYTSELVRMLTNDFSAQDICVNLKVCNGTANRIDEYSIYSNGDILTNEIPDNTINGEVILSPDNKYEFSPDCILCEKIVKEVEKKVVHKKSKEEIKEALKHACENLKNLKNKCLAFIDKHGNQIAELLFKELSVKVICRELGYCILKDPMDLQIDEALRFNVIAIPSSTIDENIMEIQTYTQPKMISTKVNVEITDKNSCVLCEFIMVQIEKELQDKKTQSEIENAIKNICKSMPKSINQECSKFVDQYGTLVIQLIATSPPREICGKLSLCGAKQLPREETNVEILECAVCHASALALAPIVENSKQPLLVSHVIDTTCNQLPSHHYDQCSNLLDIYGQSLINIIASKELHTACAQIGKCFRDEYVSFVRIDGKM